ncbi:hypothetical protein JTE90_029310 [Oedothorax gibbosus]|uniref:RING finger protein 141 n=1 Tax=Oedothorax gibbosus TaxID=931172 RepID=A0AAV6TXU7_9ARAC|nr:hypothetical protein JTE90_029310 [Oedothorax gibbosus]
MGQSVSNQLETFKDDVVKEAHNIKEIIDISHEEFLEKIKEVNSICLNSVECQEKKMHFFIKKGSDSTFLWKQTVRINCIRVNNAGGLNVVFGDATYDEETLEKILAAGGQEVEEYKLLTLGQFLLAHKMILYHYSCMQDPAKCSPGTASSQLEQGKTLSTSMILDKVTSEPLSDTDECIICMERKPEVTLPCAHAYCLFCIEQWNVSNKTCPMCRETVENTDDSWVTPEIPESSEMHEEMQKALTVLTHNMPEK